MNSFVVELWDNEGAMCTFYTVRWEDAVMNETDKFFYKYNAIPELQPALQDLLSFLQDSIGDYLGAVSPLFNRFENEVIGLPNSGRVIIGEIIFNYPFFPLRLYAIRVLDREDLVILFNGGAKSARTNQGSKDLNLKWKEACVFARRIEEALRSGVICVDHRRRKLTYYNGNDLIIL